MTRVDVRKVDENDRYEIMELAREVHYEGAFAEIPFSETKFNGFFNNCINDPEHYLGAKVFLPDKILGFAYCMLGGYFIGEGASVVTVNTICVNQGTRSSALGGRVALNLISGIDYWARQNEADVILFHVTSGQEIQGIDRFFKKLGMTHLGGNYGVKLDKSKGR